VLSLLLAAAPATAWAADERGYLPLHLAAMSAAAAAMQQLLLAAPQTAGEAGPQGKPALVLAQTSKAPAAKRWAAAATLFPYLALEHVLGTLLAPATPEERAAVRFPLVVELLRQHLPLRTPQLWNMVRSGQAG